MTNFPMCHTCYTHPLNESSCCKTAEKFMNECRTSVASTTMFCSIHCYFLPGLLERKQTCIILLQKYYLCTYVIYQEKMEKDG